jgi:KDO2-lipid IV(A) lauroyltransferase
MFLLKAISLFIRLLPFKIALSLGEMLGLLSYYLFPSRRAITVTNLKLTRLWSNLQINCIAREVAKSMGKNIIEFLRLPSLSQKRMNHYIEWEGLEHLENAFTQNRGVFILTAHLGNWDLIASAVALKGYRVNLITKHLKIGILNKFWLSYRAKMGINQLYRQGSLREIISALKNNELIGFVLDQHTKSTDGIIVDFFNRPAWTTPSLAVLSQRYNVPVVPGFIIRQPNQKHKIIFEPPITFLQPRWDGVYPPMSIRGTVAQQSTNEETIRYNTQVYTNVIERYVRKYPEQWIWMHRRWKKERRA